MINIKIYSIKGCNTCELAKIYLKSKNIQYTELDARKHLDELTKGDCNLSLPIIKINDRKYLKGFNRRDLDDAIKYEINEDIESWL